MRRVFGGLGRGLVTLGILILAFVAYQLWGTGIYASREQDRLRDQFGAQLRRSPPTTTTTEGTVTTTTVPGATTTTSTTATPTTGPAPPPPPEGDAVARIQIPKIAVDSIVINGITREDLRKAPGHYPDTPMPGQAGNAAIAGHRTTYGAPFGNLDQLANGDEIRVRTLEGSFTFRVYEQLVVEPGNIGVLDADPARPATLTLTTCNPRYSASQRLIVKAELEQEPLPAPEIVARPKLSEEGLSGEESSKSPVFIWGAIAAAVGALWWLVFHRHPRWTNWLAGVVPFAVALFFFYSFLERILPANY